MSDDININDWLRAVVEDVSKNTTEPLIVQTEHEGVCWPHRFELDGKARTVVCGRCKREFLPFDALDYIARNWKSYNQNLQALKSDIVHLTEVRNETRRRLRNLKGQVRRAEDKGDPR